MEVRRGVLSILVVLAVAGAIACCPDCECPECPPCPETTSKTMGEILTVTQYVVIVPPEPGTTQCRIVLNPRIVEKTQSLTFVNLSDEKITFQLPPALVGDSGSKEFYLDKDKASPFIPLVDPKPGEYIYSVTGLTDGCLKEKPTPKIVIP